MHVRGVARRLALAIALVSASTTHGQSATTTASPRSAQRDLTGFTAAHSERQRALEKQFMAVPDTAQAESELRTLTAEPHLAGSPADRRNADFVLQQLKSFGLDAEIEDFPVLLSEPKVIKLDVLSPVAFSGPTPENVPEDAASRDTNTTVGFNGYSASGDVTAQVVYANYGLPEDYDVLREHGVSPDGKIVIVRYGKSYRGAKAFTAQEHNAAALIIYSDPRDDGYHAGEAYPNGPWRPASGVQRGSVLYDFIYPGTLPDRSTVPRIPVIPLSFADARHVLEQLAGGVAPRDWQGGLPFTYHFGAGPVTAHLHVEMSETTRPIWNVIATVRGSGTPEEWVVLGNHRDAWTYGAVDPNSGTVAFLEMARGLGALMRNGWRPRRTIILCSWDAEEQSEFGSTHWAEKNAAAISEKAVAYLNLDVAVGGDEFSAAAVPSLKSFLEEVASDVPDPKGGSVWQRANENFRGDLRRDVRPGYVPSSATATKPIDQQEASIGDLGSGTDFVTFLDHLGIPSTDFSFGGDYGVYHSIFDNFRWMKQFGDPAFRYHVAAAKIYGLETLRLAEADILPLDYETYGVEIQRHLGGIATKLALLGQSTQLDMRPAQSAAKQLAAAGKALTKRRQTLLASNAGAATLYGVNRTLVTTEREFLVSAGLPRRPWFKHSIFGPGFYNGYAPVPLPGVLEMIDARNFDEARRQLVAVTEAINRATARLRKSVPVH